jgi:hypothetical protein
MQTVANQEYPGALFSVLILLHTPYAPDCIREAIRQ